jgi:hypothetical protein
MELSDFNHGKFLEYKNTNKPEIRRFTTTTALGTSEGETIKYMDVEDNKL